MGPIFLAQLATASHLVLQGIPNMLSLLGLFASWASVVLVAGSSMIPSVNLGFVVPVILVGCRFLGVHMGM